MDHAGSGEGVGPGHGYFVAPVGEIVLHAGGCGTIPFGDARFRVRVHGSCAAATTLTVELLVRDPATEDA